MVETLVMAPETAESMIADCRRRWPDEACGMLVGRKAHDGVIIERAIPFDNVWPVVTQRPTRYAIDPLRQMRAERDAEAAGLTVLGYYHSHPTGVPVPSEVDHAMAWPGYVYLIVGLSPTESCRAWVLSPGGEGFEELQIIRPGPGRDKV